MENSEKARNDYFSDLSKRIKDFDLHITEVKDIAVIGLYNYDKKTYDDLVILLKEGKLEEATAKYHSKTKSFEDITAVSFTDQFGSNRVAVFYDSDDMWQDAQLKELFGAKKLE